MNIWAGVPVLISLGCGKLTMRYFPIYILLFALIISVTDIKAQIPDTVTTTVEDQIKSAVEDIDIEDNPGSEELLEYLQYLSENPININRATIDEMLQLPGINLRMATGITEYRRSKPFQNVDELKKVKGLGAATLNRIRPYITVGSRLDLKRQLMTSPGFWTDGLKTDYIARTQKIIEQQAGYKSDGNYSGSQSKYYHRITSRSRHVSMNITQEIDAGEPFAGNLGFDFTSMHLAVNDVGYIRSLVFGDYSINSGQGLVFWPGGSFGKGRDVTGGVSKNERGLRPYRSSLEYGFLRGTGFTLGTDNFEATLFYSSNKVTASEVDSIFIRFPSASGFHRTETERKRRYNTDQTMYGGRIRYIFSKGSVGVSGYESEFSKPIAEGTAAYQIFNFKDKKASVIGTDYRFFNAEMALTGEIAMSKNGGWGMIHSLEWDIDSFNDLAVVYRNYKPDFQSIFGSGFGEQSGNPSNEIGYYLGYRFYPKPNWTLQTYVDLYTIPKARFGYNQPSSGIDWLGSADWRMNSTTQFSILLRAESRTAERKIESNEKLMGVSVFNTDKETRRSSRFELEHWIEKKLRLRNRVEIANYTAFEDNEFGWLIYQDVRWIINKGLRIDARYTLFDTDSYNARVYQFENDLLYVLSNPVLSGKGQRTYLLLNYQPFKNFNIWIKWDTTIYEDQFTVGSGQDQVEGNSRNRIGIQIRYQF